MSDVQRVARGGVLTVSGAVVSAISGVLLIAVVTNGFDQTTAGTLFATTSVFLILVAVAQMGTEVGLVRWIPEQVVRKSRAGVRDVLRAALLPVLIVSSLLAVGTGLMAPWIAGSFADGNDPAVAEAQIVFLSAFLPVAALTNTLLAGTRGFRTMRPTVAVESLGRPALQLALVSVSALAVGTSLSLVAAWAVPYLPAMVAAAVWLSVVFRQCRRWPQAPDAPKGAALEFWRFTGPRALATIAQVVLKRADIVLVAALASPGAAALYTAATRFVTFGQLGVQAVQQVLAPNISAQFASGRTKEADGLYKTVTAWSMAGAWPLYLIMATTAPWVLGIFGDGYSDAASTVVILSLAMLAATAAGAVDTVLLMSGRSWLSLANNVSAAVVNVLLNLVLIPRFGITGAAAAWAVAIVLRNALPLIQVRLMLGVSPFSRASAIVAVAAALLFGALPWCVAAISESGLYIMAGLALGSVGYAGVLWWSRYELRLNEIVAALRPVRRRVGSHAPDADQVDQPTGSVPTDRPAGDVRAGSNSQA